MHIDLDDDASTDGSASRRLTPSPPGPMLPSMPGTMPMPMLGLAISTDTESNAWRMRPLSVI